MILLMTSMAHKLPAMSPARVTVIKPSFSNVSGFPHLLFPWIPVTASGQMNFSGREEGDTQIWVTANMARGTKAGQAGHLGTGWWRDISDLVERGRGVGEEKASKKAEWDSAWGLVSTPHHWSHFSSQTPQSLGQLSWVVVNRKALIRSNNSAHEGSLG